MFEFSVHRIFTVSSPFHDIFLLEWLVVYEENVLVYGSMNLCLIGKVDRDTDYGKVRMRK